MSAIEPGAGVATVPERGRAASRLSGRIALRHELGGDIRKAMFDLLSNHFVGVESGTFETDLAEKDCAILVEDHGLLRGFSTLMIYRTYALGRPIAVVYSGDTIVDREWWGSPALPRTWIRAVRQLARTVNADNLYWLLLTSGYRTYRFLPVFFQSFYPRYDSAGPPETAALLEAIAIEKFGSRYDPTTGIVRFARPQVLTRTLLELPDGRAYDPHVAYFLSRNPGHCRGDELACLTRVHDDNLTRAGRRMARGADR
jgi:hypothetical protein